MRRRFLRQIAETSFRFAGIVFVILVLVTAMAVSGARHLRFDTRLSDFLPPNSPTARRVGELEQDYRNLEPIVVSLRARRGLSESELIEIANTAGEYLDDPAYFRRAVFKVDALAQEYYESLSDVRLIALLTEEDWKVLENLGDRLERTRALRLSAFMPRRAAGGAGDPLGVLGEVRRRLARARAPIPIYPRRGYFFNRDGGTLQLLLYPVRSSDDALYTLKAVGFLERARDFLYDRNPTWRERVTIEYFGSHIATAEKIRATARELAVIVGVTILLLLVLLVVFFRKAEAVVFVLAPPALGLIWALGLYHAFSRALGLNPADEMGGATTRVTAVTAAFLLITFGIGLSYSLHLFHRFTIELYRTRNYYRALQISYVETGRAIFASAVTSALIFFLLFLTSFRGLKELGVLAALATLCNLAACMLTVPTLAALKSWIAKGRVSPIVLAPLNVSRLSEAALRLPRATLGAALVITIFFGMAFRTEGFEVMGLKFHPRFGSIAAYLFRPETPAESLETDSPRPGRPVVAIVEADTIQEALERNDRLYDDLTRIDREAGERAGIQAIDSLRVVLPSLVTQRRSLQALKQFDLEALERSVHNASRMLGLQPSVFESFVEQIADLQRRSVDWQPLEYSSAEGDAFVRTVQRFVTHRQGRYRIATPIFPGAEGFTQAQTDLLIRAAAPPGSEVAFIGDPIIERELSERLKFDLALLILLSALAIFAALVLHFRGLRPAVLAFIAVAVQGIWVGGAMVLFGVPLHLLTLMAMPLGVTLALDNVTHLLQNFRDRQSMDVRFSLVTLGRSIVLSCTAIGLLYGTLALASLEGLRDLGRVVLFGAGASLVATLALLPAMIRLWGRDEPLLSILRPGGTVDR